MKNKLITLAGLLLSGIIVQANITIQQVMENETLPQGIWKIEQIKVERFSDRNMQAAAADLQAASFNSVAAVRSHIPCPQEWNISEKSITLRYPNGTEEIIENTMTGNQLTVYPFDGTMQVYQCSVMDEKLMLTVTHQYNKVTYVRQDNGISSSVKGGQDNGTLSGEQETPSGEQGQETPSGEQGQDIGISSVEQDYRKPFVMQVENIAETWVITLIKSTTNE